jgi:hypothetical protein
MSTTEENYLSDISYDLHLAIKNLLSSHNDNDISRQKYHKAKVRNSLRLLIDEHIWNFR